MTDKKQTYQLFENEPGEWFFAFGPDLDAPAAARGPYAPLSEAAYEVRSHVPGLKLVGGFAFAVVEGYRRQGHQLATLFGRIAENTRLNTGPQP